MLRFYWHWYTMSHCTHLSSEARGPRQPRVGLSKYYNQSHWFFIFYFQPMLPISPVQQGDTQSDIAGDSQAVFCVYYGQPQNIKDQENAFLLSIGFSVNIYKNYQFQGCAVISCTVNQTFLIYLFSPVITSEQSIQVPPWSSI